jgi:DNA-binding response OmpR family regulator
MKEIKVLIVDDEAEFRDTLAMRFQLRGLKTRCANDGEIALGLIADDPPQYVVLDVMMPGLSGLEVLQKIKETYPQINVILLTGRGSTQDGIKGMQLGAMDYLMKPIDIEELLSRMN